MQVDFGKGLQKLDDQAGRHLEAGGTPPFSGALEHLTGKLR